MTGTVAARPARPQRIAAAGWAWLRAAACLLALLLYATGPAHGATLVGEWKFETLTADTSGNGKTLSTGTGVVQGTGLSGYGMVLPNNAAARTSSSVLDTSTSFSVSAWVKFDTTVAGCYYQTIVEQDGTNVSGFFLELIPTCDSNFNVTGSPHFEFMMLRSDSGSAVWHQAISTTVPQVGVWYHVAGVRDTASSTIKLYVNGVLEATTSYGYSWSATGKFGIGSSRWNGNYQDYVDGTVDSVRAYQGALTASEVADLSLEPMADWRTDESAYSGATGEAVDNTGNGWNATAVGLLTTTNGSGKVCSALSIPSNTVTTNALNTGVAMDTDVGSRGSIAFWYRSNTAWGSGSDTQLLDATISSNQSFHLVRRGNGSLRAAITDSTGTTLSISTSNQSFAAGTWVHLVLTWKLASGSNASQAVLYVNGTATSTTGTTSGALNTSIGTLYIGDSRNGVTSNNATTNSADGRFDEIHLYKYPLNSTQVSADAAETHTCPSSLDHVEAVPSSTSASTCSTASVTLKACANAACTSLVSSYTGTINLTTGSGRGDWSAGTGPAPQGTLANGTANDGAASYTFVAGDSGSAKLLLSHSLAQDVTVTAVDSVTPSTSRTSAAIQFRDNAFVFAEDASNKIAGSDVAVAGRPHDLTVTLVKKDPTTGSCGTATDYSGSRNLKMWRTDSGGTYTAPTVVSPALTIPSSQPGSSNLALTFTSGVAGFNLGTTDIGRYSLSLLDDSLAYAATSVSGSSNTLTVRPFAVVVRAIAAGATNNPGGSLATDSVFTSAGSAFQATVGAYRWTSAMTGNGTDANDDGLPDGGATLTNTIAGGLAPSFGSTVTLSPLAASQTPSTGTLGTLSNGSITGFSGGVVTPTNLSYSEVGSFALATTGVVSNFLGSGLSLDATVFNASGAQSTRVGRFKPAKFALSAASVTHRSGLSCSPASTFTYLGENFRLQFTLTAQNASGAPTVNYTGTPARLEPTSAAGFSLAGIAGSTVFSTAGASPRLSLGSATGSWSNGVASGITLTASALRSTSPDGPFAASFGIAPADSDGVLLGSYDLDTDSPSNGNDRGTVGSVALCFGRLRMANAVGSQNANLALPVTVQHWTGSAFDTNTLDSCTSVPTTAMNFGNLRKTITASDTAATGAVTIASGLGRLVLAKPAAGRSGSFDVALSLGSSATDASCLQTWTPATGDAATAGANLSYLRGNWCASTYDKDPSARATFGVYRGVDSVVYERENY